MKANFHVYLRQHQTRWYTAQVLTLPRYSAYGPHPSRLSEELALALALDVHEHHLLDQPHFFEGLRSRAIRLEIKAVQHERLVTVPMRFTIAHWVVSETEDLHEIIVPRLSLRFRLQGEENIDPWVEESIRGTFHMTEVSKLLSYRYERSERIAPLEVSFFGADRFKKLRGPRPSTTRARQFMAPPPLAEFGTELVGEAKADRIGRALHRDDLVLELASVLSSRRSPSALLVGPSGVGKTAVVHELASRVHRGQVPPRLQETQIWSIGASRIIAGAKFLGEWQERATAIVNLLRKSRYIVYLGNLLEVVTTGSEKTGLNVARFLLPWIQSGELSVIVEATPDSLALAESKHGIFVRALQRVPVPALDGTASVNILERHARGLTKTYGATWAPGVMSEVLDVVGRFGDPGGLPGSAIALLERIAQSERRSGSDNSSASAISRGAAIRTFAQMSGFPEALVDPRQKLDVTALRQFFNDRVIGQPRATELLSNVVLLLKAGLNDPEKPLGSYLFMGPTGVGKTESALTLAEYLFRDRKRVIRFDMSEYGDPGSALRLISGADGQGPLTKKVREQPFSLLLFDEIEKADTGVFDLLLQILGEGRLTDDSGQTVRYTHCIIILTSNLGAGRKPALGFSEPSRQQLDRQYLEAAENFFRPEMINRIDHLVPFQDLSRESLAVIADGLLQRALQREGLSRRGIAVELDPRVKELIIDEGFDPKYGARPMKRAVERRVVAPLAQRITTSASEGRRRLRLVLREHEVEVTEVT